jgi:ADP-ribosylglycohydrolase
MPNIIEMRLKPHILEKYGLPDIEYPVRLDALDAALGENGEMPFAEMLFGLQERGRKGTADWQRLEPAMERLAQILAPQDDREIFYAADDNWRMELGPVDLVNAKLVAIQRGGLLIAALAYRGDGRLRVAVFRPLDAKSINSLIALNMNPDPEHGVNMRENNWEYAIDQTPGLGNAFADERGEAYLCYWEKGLGLKPDGTIHPEWRAMTDLVPRRPTSVIVELAIYCSFSDEYQATWKNNPESEPAQAAPYPQWVGKRQQQRAIRGRYSGCLLGGAIGDALGAPVEFMRRAEIITRFGPKGITQYAPAYGGLGTITDDTQMTLFTAEGLLRAVARQACSDYTPLMEMVAESYLRWLFTQGIQPSVRIPTDSWLTRQKSLHDRRAPGNTCLAALREMQMPPMPSKNNSKGCGGVMRMAPVGLIGRSLKWDARRVFDSGCLIALLTHGHPSGVFPAGVLATLILALIDGASLQEGLITAKALLCEKENYEET